MTATLIDLISDMKRENTEIRQEQIKKAVLELIVSDGLHQVSTRNLAKQIGLTEGAIFRHFKSKRDIIKAIMDDVSVDLIGTLRQIILKPTRAEKKMFEYLCANVKYLRANKGITILLFSEATHLGDKELKNKLSEIYEQTNNNSQANTIEFDNYEIAHFRLLSDVNYLPYGRSYLEPGRKLYKQYSLMEDDANE